MDRSINEGVRHLHQLHIALREATDERERGPRVLKVKQQATAAKLTDLENQRARYKQLRVAADQKSMLHKGNETKIDQLKAKLNQAASNREFDAFRTQIAADTMANSVLEGEILDLIEKVDEAQLAIKKCETELAACKAEEERFAAAVAAADPGLAARVDDLKSQITQSEGVLPGDVVPLYRRLVQKNGDAAIAAVEDSICTSCYVKLPPQIAVSLRGGVITFCKTCGRLLYCCE